MLPDIQAAPFEINLRTSKLEWPLNDIRIEKSILVPIWDTNPFLEVSGLLNYRHCLKLQSCTLSRKTNDATLRKLQKP